MIVNIEEYEEIIRSLKVASTYVPTPERCSIIGDASLNFRVRNGAGCFPRSNDTTKRSNGNEGSGVEY